MTPHRPDSDDALGLVALLILLAGLVMLAAALEPPHIYAP